METDLKLEPGGFGRWSNMAGAPPFLVRNLAYGYVYFIALDGSCKSGPEYALEPIPSTPELIQQFRPIIEPLARAVGFVPGPKFKFHQRLVAEDLNTPTAFFATEMHRTVDGDWLYKINGNLFPETRIQPYTAPAPPPVIEVGDTVSHPYISENVKVEAMGSNDTVCLRYPNGSLECCRLDDLTLVSTA